MSNFSTNNHNSPQKPKRQRRTFTDEFKRDAVNLVVKAGYAITDAAKCTSPSPESNPHTNYSSLFDNKLLFSAESTIFHNLVFRGQWSAFGCQKVNCNEPDASAFRLITSKTDDAKSAAGR